ncbi:uncharacterized protein N7500_008559 [Penicillium coprophilum]|uniref:uncharacterized protein n=1 Tax=Penicillium coprophilum TaxID=36646 RepID=UPI0023A185D5|nr:uncharacterized protein N7500_008559 [Penicillium coprophilum]KAJ5158908.1 hypothetical protein N7500_008559 [Penicillium coprophilum]
MATDDEDLMGFALRRNGTCASDEENCGVGWSPFRRCCPGRTQCPSGKDEKGICCPTSRNCLAAFYDKPRCADPTADLYFTDQTDGYHCCPNDTRGFYTVSKQYAICATEDGVKALGVKVVRMEPVVQSYLPSTSSDLGGGIGSTPTSDSANSGSSHSNTGAIAGGVVGGVAGVGILIALAWFLLRRRRKNSQDTQPVQPVQSTQPTSFFPAPASELSGSNQATEQSYQSVSELPAERKVRPAELAS